MAKAAVSIKLAATGKWVRTKMKNRGQIKPKNCINSYEVSGVDGFKEVSVGPAKYDARMKGDFSKTGTAAAADHDISLDDQKARAERYGVDIDSSDTIGLGLS